MKERFSHAHQWLTAMTLRLLGVIDDNSTDGDRSRQDNDRGDVPGWVMIHRNDSH